LVNGIVQSLETADQSYSFMVHSSAETMLY